MKSAQNSTFILPALASLLVLTGCATSVEEPATLPTAPEAVTENTDNNRLVVPTAPVNNTQRLAVPVPGATEAAPDANASTLTAINNPATPQVPGNQTVSAVSQPDSPLPILNPTSTATSANTTALADNTAVQNNEMKPHHQTDDISVITWRAERGHIPSQLLLGEAYFNGTGVNKDLEQSRLWLELASMQGDRTAQYMLGQMYFTGNGVRQDYLNAREWWLESAISGNDRAQQKLGYLYSEGLGVDRNFTKARSWYVKAANLGNAEAQTLLGSLFHEGNRLETDYDEAFKWYQLAAHQGHPHAQYALGILHHDGLGAPQDYVKCAAWIDVALANNYDDELGASEMCRGKLDAQSNAAADSLATLWKSRYLPNNGNTAF